MPDFADPDWPFFVREGGLLYSLGAVSTAGLLRTVDLKLTFDTYNFNRQGNFFIRSTERSVSEPRSR